MNALSSLSSRNRYSVLVIIFDFFILGLGAILIGSFLPTMREEYGLGYSLSGILVSVYNFGNIAIGLITGFLALFFGRKRCYLALTVLTSVGFLLMLATRQPVVLLPAFLMAGLARGAGVNYGNGVINELSHDNASLLNLVNALFALGALLAPFLLLGLDTVSPHGWRIAVLILAAAALVSAAMMVPMKLDDTASSGGKQADFGFFRNKLFWLTVLFSLCYMSVETSVTGWMVSFFTESGAASESFSLILNGLFWSSILLGRFACASLSARISTSRLLVLLSGGMLIFFLCLMLSHSLVFMVASTIGFGLSVSGMYATAIANGGEIFQRYPFALGYYTTIAGSAGIVMPSVIGLLADRFGIRTGMSILFLPLVFQLVFVLVNDHRAVSRSVLRRLKQIH